ncbi:uncharacterized protein G2W53_037757 [Senna tora]|uniref:Uncharacterized protein n=1 Tax=Senna tora TaxID=362788 RepID=A0A834W4M2_9FABA|nr:uncharacterized protein G2W53_037757 [Senna tora]
MELQGEGKNRGGLGALSSAKEERHEYTIEASGRE